MKTRFLVVVERAANNYSAYSPDLPGCIATGRTREETRQRMQEAIELHLRGMVADHLPLPEPSASADYIEVAV